MARVLVVDDDPTVREVVVSYLRAARHDVVEAEDGEQGLALTRDGSVDLVVRDDSVLRRAGERSAPSAPATHTDGDLVVDATRHVATLGGEPLALTVREFDLLHYLVGHPGTAFSRDQLLADVWGWSFGDQSTVTVHVRRLREKVEPDPTHPARLVTVWGVGYRWKASA